MYHFTCKGGLQPFQDYNNSQNSLKAITTPRPSLVYFKEVMSLEGGG